MQIKFAAFYIGLVLVLLTLLNVYPITLSRDLVFRTKQASMQNQASIISAALSALDTLTQDGVNQVMSLLEIMNITRIMVTDSTSRVVYDTSPTESGVGKYALYSEISRALSGKDVFYSSFFDGAFMSRAATPVVSRGNVIGSVYIYDYDFEQAELIMGIQKNLVRVSLLISGFTILLAALFSRGFTRRIKSLLDAIKIVREGQYGYKITVKGKDELSELGGEFNSLSDRLQSTEEIRRRFVSDASHELKTPLASIRLLSDSIVQNEDMDEAIVREFIDDIGREAERLSRTTQRLMQLTKLDSHVEQALECVDVKHVAEKTLHMLEPLAKSQGITLKFNLSDECFIKGTEDGLYEIIFNLVENGIKYNVKGGAVKVLTYLYNDVVRIVVDDTGIGIPPEDAPNVFDRFYRVEKARSREAGGSGLGLAIVKDTVVSYGGTVELIGVEKGTRFRVCFPAYTPTRSGDDDEK